MATTLEELQVLITAETRGLRQSVEQVKRDLGGMSKHVSGATASIGKSMRGIATAATVAVGAIVGLGVALKASAQDAIQFEASVGQINRLLGQNASSFHDWAAQNRAALGLSRLEVEKYGATYANLLSSFTRDTGQTTKFTEDLLKTSSVVASKTGRSLSDTMDRIRSGLLGETDAIEDLGININVSMIESTKAFKRFAGDKSWEQLDFKTQGLIRYYAILEQAATKYGTTLANNTATRQAQFVAQLKDIRLYLGQSFLPIYNTVLPALTQLASTIAGVLQTVSQFMQALFGVNVTGQAQDQAKATTAQSNAVDGLGDSYKDAGKAAKGALASFDEVNTLPSAAGAAGAAGGAAGGASGLPKGPDIGKQVEGISKNIQAAADRVKKALKDWANDPSVKKLTDGLIEFRDSLKGLGQAITDFLNTPAVQKVGKWIADTLGEQFINARLSDLKIATGTVEGWTGFFEVLTGLVTLDWGKVKQGLKDWGEGLKKTSEGFINIVFPDFQWSDVSAKWEDIKSKLGDVWDKSIGAINWGGIKDAVLQSWDDLKTETGPKWELFKQKTSELWENTKNAVKWDSIKQAIIDSWTALGSETTATLGKFKTDLSNTWTGIQDFIHWDSIKAAILQSWDDLNTEAGDKWTAIKGTVSTWWDAVKGAANWNAIKESVNSAWDHLNTDVGTKWLTIKTTVSEWWGKVRTVANWDDIKNSVLTSWDNLNAKTGEWFGTLKKTVSDKWKLITELDFSGAKTAVLAVWDSLKTKTDEIWGDIAQSIKDSVNVVIDAVNVFIRKINAIHIDIPTIDIPLVGKVGGGSVSLPPITEIPRLARGGIVNGATTAVIGEAGAEAIVPLENTSFINTLASAIGSAVLTAMQFSTESGQPGSGGGDLTFQLDGTVFARLIGPYLATEQRRLGSTAIQTI